MRRSNRPAIATARVPTPRRSSTPTSSGATRRSIDLRGMFAFAIWDAPRRRLLLARDRLGVKPLYWAMADDRLVFGSEIKSILESGLIARARRTKRHCPNCWAPATCPGTETLFKGIQRLQPGHTLTFERGEVFDPSSIGIFRPDRRSHELARLSDRGRRAAFRDLLEEAVRIRLMGDVPLGMFLSGGLDSSAIAALMARHDRRRCRRSPSRSRSGRSASSITHARSHARSRRTHTKSSSTIRTSSARFLGSSGTKTSRSRIPRAFRCIS